MMAIYSYWCGNVLMQVNNLPLNYGWPNVYDSIDPIQLQTYYFGQMAQEGLFSSSEILSKYTSSFQL